MPRPELQAMDAGLNQMRMKSTWEAVRKAGSRVLAEVAKQDYDEHSAFAIRLALEEGLNNAVKHGNKMDASKEIVLDYDVTPQRVEIVITDEGEGFDPKAVPDPTLDENLTKPYGRGIMLMKAFVNRVEFSERGNSVRLIKERN